MWLKLGMPRGAPAQRVRLAQTDLRVLKKRVDWCKKCAYRETDSEVIATLGIVKSEKSAAENGIRPVTTLPTAFPSSHTSGEKDQIKLETT